MLNQYQIPDIHKCRWSESLIENLSKIKWVVYIIAKLREIVSIKQVLKNYITTCKHKHTILKHILNNHQCKLFLEGNPITS